MYYSDKATSKHGWFKAEIRWHTMKLTLHYELCVDVKDNVHILVDLAKRGHCKAKIEEAGDKNNLAKIVEALLHHKSPSNLPSCDTHLELAR